MVNILLINSDVDPDRKYGETTLAVTPPLSLLSLATYLDKFGHSVDIIDTRIEKNYLEQIKTKLEKTKYILVGFSVMTAQIPQAIQICKLIKEEKIPIVWGGVHPSLFPEQTCTDELIDYVIKGEGEETLLELVNTLKENRQINNIDGLVYKKENKVIVNKDRELIDIKNIPPINYDLLDINSYINVKLMGKNVRRLEVQTSRACPSRCAFCINTILFKRKWRARSVEVVLDEIENLVKKYDMNFLWIADESFFVDKVRVEKILDGIIERNLKIRWRANVRANCFSKNYINDEFMNKMKKSGCYLLGMGVESGSTRVLDLIKKDIKIEQVLDSAKLAKKFKIMITYAFMIGIPTETRKEMYDTMALMDKIKKVAGNYHDILGQQAFRPYPGSELYNMCRAKIEEPKTLRDWFEFSKDKMTGYLSSNLFLYNNKKDKDLVENSGKYATVACKSWRNLITISPFFILAGIVCKLRWKFRFFKYPVDYSFYKFSQKIFSFY